MMNKARSLCTALGAIVLGCGLVACSSGSTPSSNSAPTAVALATQSAPTVQTAATNAAQAALSAGPTAQAVATQAAPTVQAVASQVAPTVQAVVAQAAPSLQAAATQAASPAATALASIPMRILGAQSSGTDSTITLQNASDSPVDLSGWVLQVGTATAHLPSGLTVQSGQSVTLHSSAGTSTATDVYLGADASALAQQAKPGARVVLQNPSTGGSTAFTIPSV